MAASDQENTSTLSVDTRAADLATDAQEFSWLDPHPVFVVVLVGPDEKPFGIQKDFLCAKSTHFQEHFAQAEGGDKDKVEHVVRLPNVPVQVFARCQLFLFTGSITSSSERVLSYELLVDVWKLGDQLGFHGLCEHTLKVMAWCKRATHSIPDTPLLVQVWKDTSAGSSIRHLLLTWAAEFLRSGSDRSEFARALPQELLSELVLAMSATPSSVGSATPPASSADAGTKRRSVFDGPGDVAADYRDGALDGGAEPSYKRARYHAFESAGTPAPTGNGAASARGTPVADHPKPARTSLPTQRRSTINTDIHQYSSKQKLEFCADLMNRMLSGPGFWTRLVGPFRYPVEPEAEGIPDYFTKVKNPMDLGTIKENLEQGRYKSEQEFLRDVRQIFTNVYIYWKKGDAIWSVCERLEKTFEEKYGQMYKWLKKDARDAEAYS